MFDNLSDRLAETFKRLKGHGKLSEANIADALREVRLALLEADVNYKVAKDFVAGVRERAVGQEVMKSLTPAQQVIKIVREELSSLMGGQAEGLNLIGRPPQVLMMVGLQGAGKTTTAGKLARMLAGMGKKPLLVPADVQRPAAIEQLKKLGAQLGVPVHDSDPGGDPVDICVRALGTASRLGCDALILDTAGRLHIDEPLMAQLERIKQKLQPGEILLVADAMTGQDAVNVAEAFHQRLGLSGVVLTKVEGDARGGAALSIRAVTGVPIKLVGVGEKLDALEPFHPDRMAGRILGMGDVLSLVEKAASAFEQEKAQALAKKMAKNEFDLEDFREQIRQIRKLGSLESILGMLPGAGKLKGMKDMQPDEKEIGRVEAIISSMTPGERAKPQIIDASRRKRIAAGSGVTVADVNRLLKNFTQAKKMMKQVSKLGGKRKGLKRLLASM
ncbi:signal recognition particle protein [Desulfarculus baarsii DSM 2075]|uniref:Signal recognition particle protein n=1 Tax=Desulfarculus baarsii (strain ATCC 33931 / DSM 2075 / LMG 7858 / VKM B-1802 / 2st14) TaxID=644282 RepID=E1QLT7_DESB2|nr:signal recognition particle protein [Desulfarculus baarsii]ADK86522.1 signal recognition particle protein [Desulfarculus baarsii DSM 2075]